MKAFDIRYDSILRRHLRIRWRAADSRRPELGLLPRVCVPTRQDEWVIEVRAVHTADADPASLEAARRLLHGVFEGDWTDEDWDHSLGGMHVLAWEGDELVGHAAVVQRRLVHGGRALRTGYVEGVGVRADRQRRGYGYRLMAEVERVVKGAYELGALSSSEAARGLYLARGWELWRGALFRLTPHGIERTADEDGGLYVLPVTAAVDLDADVVCDWRDGETW